MSLEESIKHHKDELSDSSAVASTAPSTPPNSKRVKLVTATDTPGRIVSQRVSDESKADYSVYTIKTAKDDVIAVLMEAKVTTNQGFKNALAQVSPCMQTLSELSSPLPLKALLPGLRAG